MKKNWQKLGLHPTSPPKLEGVVKNANAYSTPKPKQRCVEKEDERTVDFDFESNTYFDEDEYDNLLEDRYD
jgi:hypothetical protein